MGVAICLGSMEPVAISGSIGVCRKKFDSFTRPMLTSMSSWNFFCRRFSTPTPAYPPPSISTRFIDREPFPCTCAMWASRIALLKNSTSHSRHM